MPHSDSSTLETADLEGEDHPLGSILIVDDEQAMRTALADELAREGYAVHEAATADEGRKAMQRELIDLALLDLRIGSDNGIELLREFKERRPETAVIMLTAFGLVQDAVEAIKLGAYDFVEKPFDVNKLLVGVKNAIRDSALKEEVRFHRSRQRPRFENEVVLGDSAKMREVLFMVDKISQSPSTTVLLLGETGVGKDVIARTIHWRGPDADGPFVDVNCGAVPHELLESELFGHERGSFTSADRTKKGLFEIAHGGTLFLDEIGDMPMALQAKLLRVLESKRFRRVGGTQEIRVSVRIISATNKDLSARVRSGEFREDLYYRLSVVGLPIPPLRERVEDIDTLADAMMVALGREMGRRVPQIDAEARALMRRYHWPGNVRELRNVLERAILISAGEPIRPASLPQDIRDAADAPAAPERSYRGPVRSMEEAERDAIVDALHHTGGNKTRAAELLGISRQTLRTKVRQYNIEDEVARRQPTSVES